ncbi:MAG: hypothetical protein RR922_05880 [Clostridia bacterium]
MSKGKSFISGFIKLLLILFFLACVAEIFHGSYKPAKMVNPSDAVYKEITNDPMPTTEEYNKLIRE